MGSKSCGSIFNKIFETGNVIILGATIFMFFAIVAALYYGNKHDLKDKYMPETSVTSVEEITGTDGSTQYLVSTKSVDIPATTENLQAYEAESAQNLKNCIIYFAAITVGFVLFWLVLCAKL